MSSLRTLSTLAAAVLLTACALPASQPAPIPPEPQAADTRQPTRPLPEDSVYDLLIAEFALRNQDLNTALAQYRKQADATGDVELIATTARLADYMDRYTLAETYAMHWLEADNDASEAHFILANALARQGQALDALPHMERVLELGGDSNFATLSAAALTRPDNEKAAFYQAINDALQRHPSDNSLRTGTALMLQYHHEEEAALSLIRQVLDEEPDNVHALLIETRTLSQMGRDDEAMTRLKYAVDNNPHHKRLRHDLARRLVKTDLYQAKAHYEVLARQYPQDHDILLELMLINRELDHDGEADQQLKALSDDPEHRSRAHYVLGRLAEEERDWADALSHYENATQSPEFSEASRRLASISLSTEGQEKALARLKALREAQPQQAEILYLLEAEILRKERLNQRGMTLMTQALAELPNSDQLRYARSLFAEGIGDLKTVETDLRHILARKPDDVAALNALGYTLANLSSRLDEAQQLVSRALTLEPDDPAILDSYGWILLLKGNTQEALNYLERAFAQDSDHEIAAHLGEAYWLLGREDEARKVWQEGLKNTPDSPIIYDTLKRLKLIDD
ncbi:MULTISPECIES: tetratricopeptide repeat protein [Spongiibacter]|uniref:tetratricopeptide repeat protein n=1 Tax=Spongiibacter TaxID=630749 RepID=UPI001B059367|nr:MULTISPECIES: tetratricopeptide repeat protein [Spongiibacter]MBO6753260.1 tetratricopeptide repeat protein [Spongiibacter sp.]|tara:strand:- start:785 stop:2500 length:1716 start_codon:yes stop_codon:yes gene_type:complete